MRNVMLKWLCSVEMLRVYSKEQWGENVRSIVSVALLEPVVWDSTLVLQSPSETTNGHIDTDDSIKHVGNDNGNEIDIDLTDPEVEKAATKIQAGFKGLKTRKELKTSKVWQHIVCGYFCLFSVSYTDLHGCCWCTSKFLAIIRWISTFTFYDFSLFFFSSFQDNLSTWFLTQWVVHVLRYKTKSAPSVSSVFPFVIGMFCETDFSSNLFSFY